MDKPAQEALTFDSLRDLEAAAALMRLSWAENRETTLDYNESFLRSCLECPVKPILTPAIYHKDSLVAMVCGIPRNASVMGRSRRLLLMTFFTVAPQWKGRGLGRSVWVTCLRLAREAGFDGAIHYCAQDHLSNHVTLKAAEQEGLSSVRIACIRFLQKLLEPSKGAVGVERYCSPQDFLEAASLSRQNEAITRVWTLAEAEWQMRGRARALSLTERAGSAVGALTGYSIMVHDEQRTRCLMIEDVLWHGLDIEQQVRMLRTFLATAAEHADMAVVPVLNYANLNAFRHSGFRLSRRAVNAYLTMWNGDVLQPGQYPLYMDVL